MTPTAPFIKLLRRAVHSKYQKLVMNNRMLMQCYDVDIDSEVGLHYILPVPDGPDYVSDFYNKLFIFSPQAIIEAYNTVHKEVEVKRKAQKLKPKELKEEHILQEKNEYVGEIKFFFYLQEELVGSTSVNVEYPIDPTSMVISNIEDTYTKLARYIKPGGTGLTFDGIALNLQYRITSVPEIYFYKVKYFGKSVRVPFCRSMFAGIQKLDRFQFTIQESQLNKDLYIFTMKLGKGDIDEIFWGYIINF